MTKDKPAISEDTFRGVEQIRSRRWYSTHQTLGEGGWPGVAKFSKDWKWYILTGTRGDRPKIRAENDEVAKAAFTSLYHLKKGMEIFEEIAEYRKVE
jgi:hypothetical protein